MQLEDEQALLGYGVYCADFRWHNGQVKPLEIGDGLTSDFQGYEDAYGNSLYELIYRHVDSELKQLGFSRRFIEACPQTYTERSGLTHHNTTLSYFDEDSAFPTVHFGAPIYARSEQQQRLALLVVKMAMTKYVGFDYPDQESIELRRATQHNNHIRVLQANDSFMVCKKNKLWLSLFQKQVRAQAFPIDFVVDLDNIDAELHNRTVAETYVIKPTDASCAQGVLVASRQNLPRLLTALQTNDKELIPDEFKKDGKFLEGFDYLIKNKKRVLVIQEFAKAELVEHCGHQFSPTGRLIFTVKHFRDQRGVVVEVIPNSMYYDLPRAPYQGDSTLDCISDMHRAEHNTHKLKTFTLMIPPSEQQRIASSFVEKSAPLMRAIMTTSMQDKVVEMLREPFDARLKEHCLLSLEKCGFFNLDDAHLRTMQRLVEESRVNENSWHLFLAQQLKLSVLSRYDAPANTDLADYCKSLLSRRQFSEDIARDLLTYINQVVQSLNSQRTQYSREIQQLCLARLEPLVTPPTFIEHISTPPESTETSEAVTSSIPLNRSQ